MFGGGGGIGWCGGGDGEVDILERSSSSSGYETSITEGFVMTNRIPGVGVGDLVGLGINLIPGLGVGGFGVGRILGLGVEGG